MLLKKLKRTAGVLLVLGFLVSGAGWLVRPAGGPALHAQTAEMQDKLNTKLDLLRLQGTWKPVAVLSAEPGAEDKQLLNRTRLVIKGKIFRVISSFDLEMPVKQQFDVDVMNGQIEINPNKMPKTMDWIVSSPRLEKPILKIYQVEGDRLKIVTGSANKRPSSLEPDPEDAKTTLYERVKEKPKDRKQADEAELQFRLRTDPIILRDFRPTEEEKKGGNVKKP
jgi:uncharacterized protein (TIGR03067 family)